MPTLESQRILQCDLHVWRSGAGPMLLFLHGYERHPGATGFLTTLAEGHEVVAPEHPGYGSSAGLEHIHDVLDLVLLYREFITAHSDGAIDVIGHSLGGMIAAELAAICPQVVRRLVLVNPFGLWLDDQPALDPFGPAATVRTAKWADPAAAPDPEPWIFEPDPEDPHLEGITQTRNLAAATKFLWPLPDRGLRRRLPLVRTETLVVQGTADGLVPLAYAEEFASLIPGARLARIDGAGHYPMLERETEFVQVVEQFLARS